MDDILRNCIQKIWSKYDTDNNGYLDRAETKFFILENIKTGKNKKGELCFDVTEE